MDYILFLGGIPVGILSALVAWWILWRVLGPKGSFSDFICVLDDPAHRGAVRYRTKFLSTGRRAMMDVAFSAVLFVPNIESDGSQALMLVPVFDGSMPRIGGRGWRREVGKPVLDAQHRVITFRFDMISPWQLDRIDAQLRAGLVSYTPGSLEAILSKYPGAVLQAVCTASDGWTGARRSFVSAGYCSSSVVRGVFRRGPRLDIQSVA